MEKNKTVTGSTLFGNLIPDDPDKHDDCQQRFIELKAYCESTMRDMVKIKNTMLQI